MPGLAHTEKPLTDEDFTTFERLFRREIPLSFKSHYMADNGGFPSEEDVEAGKWGASRTRILFDQMWELHDRASDR
jgi:hypothetical protein